jgi:AcrR family transcriptional regulator
MDGQDPALTIPKALLSAWGVEPATRKGPRPRLTVARILETAVALGDRDGAEAVTMSRTAAELGVGTMSLYRYVESRADLLLLAADAALGEPPAPGGATWRERVRDWTLALRGVYRRHPWAAEVAVAAEPLTPASVRWSERGLAALEDSGLPPDEGIQVLIMLWTYVRAEAGLTGDLERARAADGLDAAGAERALAHRIATLVPADTYPRVRALLAGGLFGGAAAGGAGGAEDADFDLVVGLVLDGVAARAARS